jgi:succinate dehydrogenase / fumarate reductase, membrane anchor subunit
MKMRTPLKTVRHLGSAREGANHFIVQRFTAVANVVLVIFLVWLVVSLVGADYGAVRAKLHNPAIALGLLLLIGSGTIHMRLGMATIIEDYVHGEGAKLFALALNTFFAILIGVTSVFAILKLSFGA